MMLKEEIALQLTLKSIERMHTDFRFQKTEENNSQFSKQVCDFYNYLFNNLACFDDKQLTNFTSKETSNPNVI